jgi:hypothetical protein
MAFIFGAFPITCMRKRLTRVTRRQNVHRLHGPEIHASDITIVGNVGPVMVEDLRRCRIVFDVPCDGGVVVGGDGQVEAAVPAEQ